MIELPRLRCPGCGKYIGPAKAKEIPPANNYNECLRRCPKCRIGATNAKNPAKTKFIRDVTPQPPQDPQPPQQ
ncbi:MAG: hypothetical protein A2049_05530 [Elusimicrobia bacterium GWA2_62_23]|nr:MAG: hypothetical protein A2049_05530 [Elusimicrobia bacterium GWA2_62_23]OGR66659.1 MAG: hypothetical protein A2179_01560 [Elusimicrobia bacterium GWC2_63_65]